MWVDHKKVFSTKNHETMATVFDPTKPNYIGEPDLTFFRQGLYHCTYDDKPNTCKNHTPIKPPDPISIYYDGTSVTLCGNSKVNNFHPNLNPNNNNTKPCDCKPGDLH